MARNLIKSAEAIKQAIKAAGSKSTRLSDGDGLYLLINPPGAQRPAWRFDYTFQTKRNTISFGTFPDSSLALARRKAQAAREQLAEGIDPSALKKTKRAEQKAEAEAQQRIEKGLPPANSLREIAKLFHDHKATPDSNGMAEWSPDYAKKFLQRMERNVLPWLGDRVIGTITWREVLACCERPQEAGKRELAHTLRMYCDQIWTYALKRELVELNVAKQLDGMLKPVNSRNMSAIIEPARVADLVLGITTYNGSLVTRTALLMSLLTFQRPFNIRTAEWAEVNLEAGTWTIPTAKMKGSAEQKLNGRAHVVPLARQLVKALRELKPLTDHRRYLFPSERGNDRPMSENTVNLALRAMGFSAEEMVAHGFRATARTLLAERVKINGRPVNEAWIEAQLAHEKAGPLGSAYDRAKFIEQRVVLMQKWADYIDGLRKKPAKADEGHDQEVA
jgi:integrase